MKTSSKSIKFSLNIYCDETRCSAVLIDAYKEDHAFESCHINVTLKLTNT